MGVSSIGAIELQTSANEWSTMTSCSVVQQVVRLSARHYQSLNPFCGYHISST